jgi:hypothetical protein
LIAKLRTTFSYNVANALIQFHELTSYFKAISSKLFR